MLNKKSTQKFDRSLEEYIEVFSSSTVGDQARFIRDQEGLEQSQNQIEINFSKNKFSFSTKEKQLKSQQVNVHLTKHHEFTLKVSP